MTRTTTRRLLAPLDAACTRKGPSFRTGRLEVWSAVTADGLWLFERTEDTGTPWRITHLPTRGWLLAESLPRAREQVASGWAWSEVARKIAESKRARCSWASRWGTGSSCAELAVPGGDRCAGHLGRP